MAAAVGRALAEVDELKAWLDADSSKIVEYTMLWAPALPVPTR